MDEAAKSIDSAASQGAVASADPNRNSRSVIFFETTGDFP
jgi:ubiquitin